MRDIEKIEQLCRELGKMRVFSEMGYKSAQNYYRWKVDGISELAKFRVANIIRKYKKILEKQHK